MDLNWLAYISTNYPKFAPSFGKKFLLTRSHSKTRIFFQHPQFALSLVNLSILELSSHLNHKIMFFLCSYIIPKLETSNAFIKFFSKFQTLREYLGTLKVRPGPVQVQFFVWFLGYLGITWIYIEHILVQLLY